MAPIKPANSGIFSSSMGDTAYISYGYTLKFNSTDSDKQNISSIKKMSEETNFIIRNGKEYVKMGDESNGKVIRREIWENRFRKTFSPLGEIVAYGKDIFGVGRGPVYDPYDFRIKSYDNELGRMAKKVDAFLKDEVSKGLGLFIGNFEGR